MVICSGSIMCVFQILVVPLHVRGKIIWAKWKGLMTSLFGMTSFCAKNSEKNRIAGWGKNLKLKIASKVHYVLQWYLTDDQINFCICFWKFDVNAKLKEQNEKKRYKKKM